LHLIQNEKLRGEIRDGAGGALFVPTFYKEMQTQKIKEIFESQGYITLTKSQSIGISNMVEFVTGLFVSRFRHQSWHHWICLILS